MSKTVLVTVGMVCLCVSGLYAQTWDEWFRQRKTQKKYLIQQITALKAYLKSLKEGYDIAKKGLGTIGDIKNGNFEDHSDYFGSLTSVNTSIKRSEKVALIVLLQRQVIRELKGIQRQCREDGGLSSKELTYVDNVYSNMLLQCEKSIIELNAIMSDNITAMTDDERLQRIDQLYTDMSEKRDFARLFSNSTRLLLTQRRREVNEVRLLESVNGGI